MATDRRAALLPVVVLAVAMAAATGAGAQEPLYRVDDDTRVEGLSFEIRGGELLADLPLRERMATRPPAGMAGLRSALAWLPLIDPVELPAFDPVALQRDVVRLRAYYRESGYLEAEVDYRLEVDEAANRVRVVVEVDPGPPRVLGGVRVEPVGVPSAGLELDGLTRHLARDRGALLGAVELDLLERETRSWVADRGYPFPRVTPRLEPGDDPRAPTVVLALDPGVRARIGGVEVVGADRLDPATLQGLLLVQPGDPYSADRIDASGTNLLDQELVEVALVEPVAEPGDSVVDLRVRVVEGDPRRIGAEVGYSDAQGVLGEVSWAHRDLLGGARTVELSVGGETGLGSFQEFPVERYRVTLALAQPRLFDARTRLVSQLYGESEDGPWQLARTLGGEVTAVRGLGGRSFLSLGYRLELTDVVEFRAVGLGALGLLDLFRLEQEAAEGTRLWGVVRLSASLGGQDRDTDPRRGWALQSSLELVGTDSWSDSQFARAQLSAAWLHELAARGPRVFVRASVGRVVPWGRGIDPENGRGSYFSLGDAVFTQGGTQRVRGWATDLLGPKIPALDIEAVGDSVSVTPRGQYVALGGLARWDGSVELQLPLGFLQGRHYGLLFLDAGRVWTPDSRFLDPDTGFPLLSSDDGAGYAAGGGLSFRTPVGAIRLMAGYKLNPTPLDVRDPLAVGEALLSVGSAWQEAAPASAWRRWRIHLDIGTVF